MGESLCCDYDELNLGKKQIFRPKVKLNPAYQVKFK